MRELDDEFTAQAFITTDLDDNQITAFHPGAMSQSHLNTVPTNGRDLARASSRRTAATAWLQHAAQFAAAGIPWLFDPGQGLPMFDGAELLDFIDKATWVAVNDYEGQMLQERTGLSAQQIAARSARPMSSRRAPKAASIHAGWTRIPDPDGPGRKPSRTRPGAATPIAPGSFSAS